MPQIKLKYSVEFANDLNRILTFYNKIDKKLYETVGKLLATNINRLIKNPEVAPYVHGNKRELHIPFGKSTMNVVYIYDNEQDILYILGAYNSREMIRNLELIQKNDYEL